MNKDFNLQTLKQHRQDLLLAEVAAWLHDMGKCADEHIINQASDKPSSFAYQYRTAQSHRLPTTLPPIRLLGDAVTVKDLIEKGRPRIISHASQPWPLRVLGKCHAVAHVEKELEDHETSTKQPKDETRLCSAFGIEDNSVSNLTSLLSGLPFTSMQDRDEFVPHVERIFDNALGDTRRPVNEVTLADWSGAVAALYKSALAGALLGIKPDPDDLRWRLLRVNFDVLGHYAKAIKIADLLGYQRAVEQACDEARQLVEVEYPLGNEIYRDTTGIYFTFPNLDLPDELGQEIRRCVEKIEPELAPRIAVTVGDGQTAAEQLKGLLAKARQESLEDLKQPFDGANFNSSWQQLWEHVSGEKKWEVCPVCRLRPKEEHDEVCERCEKRRQSRLEAWKKKPDSTIWLGEIADHNDRVALLVGKFGLEDWLSGDLVQTMLVKAEPNNPTGCTPKNPSPARLRRVWETCQRFWEDTVLQDILSSALGNRGLRRRIIPNQTNWQAGLYNGKVNGKPIDLFWQPEYNAFLTISNLQAAGDYKPGDVVTLEQPESKKKYEFQIQSIQAAPASFDSYQPYLSLNASPDQFLAFLPAADALKIVQQICQQYEEQFGKVRNRLPLFLGLVFFERKMPLMAVMDAARQMLNAPLNEELWEVNRVDRNGRVEFGNGITWNVPTVMGDGKTEDCWYPYFELEGSPAAHHTHQFQHKGKTWVHVKDLKPGDKVQVAPSRFDFLWLDSAARRFEIQYGEDGRRPARPSRPFYLEDLDRLASLWGCLQQLSRTQLKQTLQTIETARERWFGGDAGRQSTGDETFRQFVADTLANAQWPPNMSLRGGTAAEAVPQNGQGIASPPAARNDMQSKLAAAGVRGELADLEELHLEILKE